MSREITLADGGVPGAIDGRSPIRAGMPLPQGWGQAGWPYADWFEFPHTQPVDVVFVLGMCVFAVLSVIIPLPMVVSAVGLALMVPFVSRHCAEPLLHDSGAPARTIRVLRLSVGLVIALAAMYVVLELVWLVSGVWIPTVGTAVRISGALLALPVLGAYLFPTQFIAATAPRRRGRST